MIIKPKPDEEVTNDQLPPPIAANEVKDYENGINNSLTDFIDSINK